MYIRFRNGICKFNLRINFCCRAVVTYSGFTPLDFAVRSGNIDTVRRLLRVPGIDVDKASNLTNPLFTAASIGNLEIVKALVGAGADINFKAVSDVTPLIGVAANGKEDIVRYLISSGANLNELDSSGASAAGNAAVSSNSRVLQILGDAGANLTQLQGPAALPLISLATARSSVHAAAEMVKYLISKGEDVNQEDGNGLTPLLYAAVSGNTRVAELLLCAGADIDHLNDKVNVTALNAAAYKNNSETAQFLIKKGANVNLLTSISEGPAFLAAEVR